MIPLPFSIVAWASSRATPLPANVGPTPPPAPASPWQLAQFSANSVSPRAASPATGAADGADEFAIPVFLLVLVGAILFASFSVVYSAPILFAELLLDGVLATTLYRRLKKLETTHWLQTALRRTLGPFTLVAIILGLAGVGMAVYAPGARSLGEVIAYSPD